MITRETQNLLAGDTYNMSQIGYDPMTITKVTQLRGLVRLEGTRDKDGSVAIAIVPYGMEIFQEA